MTVIVTDRDSGSDSNSDSDSDSDSDNQCCLIFRLKMAVSAETSYEN